MRTMLRMGLALLIAQAFSTTAFAQAGNTRPPADTYQWSGELVSFDSGSATATVKARLVNDQAVQDVKKLKAGARVLLLWSGYETYADAIRRVMPERTTKDEERFLLPVELASNETPNQYVTFRLRIPAGSTSAIQTVKPGEWITVTSSHKATDAIVSARPYVTSGTPATN